MWGARYRRSVSPNTPRSMQLRGLASYYSSACSTYGRAHSQLIRATLLFALVAFALFGYDRTPCTVRPPSALTVSADYLPQTVEMAYHLRWVDNSDNEAGFRVQRSLIRHNPPGTISTIVEPFTTIADVPPNTTEYVDRTPMWLIVQLKYRVAAIGFDGCLSEWTTFLVEPRSQMFITWEDRCPMPTPRWGVRAAMVNDKLYLIGGSHGTVIYNPENEVYDPSTDTWTSRRPMGKAREKYGIGVVGGKIYIIGGSYPGATATDLVEMYDPSTDSWAIKSPMPTKRHECASAVLEGRIYVIGGSAGGWGDRVDTVEVYDPATDTWAAVAPLPEPRTRMGAAAVGGRVFVIGGVGPEGIDDDVLIYDPLTDTWSTGSPMPTPRDEVAVTVLDGLIYVVGGKSREGKMAANVEVYDPQRDVWYVGTPLSQARTNPACAAVNGRLYVIGGYYYGQPLSSVEEGTPGR